MKASSEDPATTGGTFVNRGSYEAGRALVNSGVFENAGSLLFAGTAGCGLTNAATGTFENTGTAELSTFSLNQGVVEHHGQLTFMKSYGFMSNEGTFNVYCGATLVDKSEQGGVTKQPVVDKCK